MHSTLVRPLLRFRLPVLICLMVAACALSLPCHLLAGDAPEERPRSWTCTRRVGESPITLLPLAPDIAYSDVALTGMVRIGDRVLLLPRYPQLPMERESSFAGPRLLALDVADVAALVADPGAPALTPVSVPIKGWDIVRRISGFAGFEAIALGSGNDRTEILLLARGEQQGRERSCLVRGSLLSDDSPPVLVLDQHPPLCAAAPENVPGYGHSALLSSMHASFLLPEANGANCGLSPKVLRLDAQSGTFEALPFPCLEYRISDVSTPDPDGRFWALNRLDEDERELLRPAVDRIRLAWGTGHSHAYSQQVARLVFMQATDDGLGILDQPPVELELSLIARDWESVEWIEADGISGLLLATDTKPMTLLGFVPLVCP